MIVQNLFTHKENLEIVDASIMKRSSNYFLVLSLSDNTKVFMNEFTSQSELANLSKNQIESLRYVHSKIFHCKFFTIRDSSELDALKNQMISFDAREKETNCFFFTQNLVVKAKEVAKTTKKKH